MSAVERKAEAPARLTLQDARDLDWYMGQTLFERSISGAALDRAQLYDVGGKSASHGLYNESYARQMAAEREGRKPGPDTGVTVWPTSITGTRTSAGGYTPDDGQITRWAGVRRHLDRIGWVKVGDPPVSVEALFMSYASHGGCLAELSLGMRPDVSEVEHLTKGGRALMERATHQAEDVALRIKKRHQFTGKEMAFVMACDLTGRHAPYHAALTAGYKTDNAVEAARRLGDLSTVQAALDMRRDAERVLATHEPFHLYAMLTKRPGKLEGKSRVDRGRAESQARDMMGAACRVWMAGKVKR